MSVLATGNMTATIKIKRLLQRDGITVEIVKLDPKSSKDGCAYGIRINDNDVMITVNLLKKNSILYHLYEGDII